MFPDPSIFFAAQLHPLNHAADRAVVVHAKIFPHLAQGFPAQMTDKINCNEDLKKNQQQSDA